MHSVTSAPKFGHVTARRCGDPETRFLHMCPIGVSSAACGVLIGLRSRAHQRVAQRNAHRLTWAFFDLPLCDGARRPKREKVVQSFASARAARGQSLISDNHKHTLPHRLTWAFCDLGPRSYENRPNAVCETRRNDRIGARAQQPYCLSTLLML